MRFFPAVVKLQEMIASGVVGDVKLVQASLGKQSSKRTERHYDPKLGQSVTCIPFIIIMYSVCLCLYL